MTTTDYIGATIVALLIAGVISVGYLALLSETQKVVECTYCHWHSLDKHFTTAHLCPHCAQAFDDNQKPLTPEAK